MPQPHVYSWPALSTAALVLCPALTIFMVSFEVRASPNEIFIGSLLSLKFPTPSCPVSLIPHENTSPFCVRKSACCSPAATMAMGSFLKGCLSGEGWKTWSFLLTDPPCLSATPPQTLPWPQMYAFILLSTATVKFPPHAMLWMSKPLFMSASPCSTRLQELPETGAGMRCWSLSICFTTPHCPHPLKPQLNMTFPVVMSLSSSSSSWSSSPWSSSPKISKSSISSMSSLSASSSCLCHSDISGSCPMPPFVTACLRPTVHTKKSSGCFAMRSRVSTPLLFGRL
mmetsp:Transcript_26668/g.53172  ORF Transcript_26668/g.53172 Transcript_26668/m.53172 type:complete len:284 (+) Transcript_26668:742-1593(+)